jgi:hypothetical protein
VALAASSAEATASAGGSLTYGDHHLSTDDSGHLPTNTAPMNGGRPGAHRQVLTPVLATGARTRSSQNTNTALAAYDVLCDPGAAGGTGRTWTWLARARRDRHPCGGRAAMLRPSGRRRHWKQHQSRSGHGRRTPFPPRTLREAAGRCPRGGGTQLGAPSSPARMMNILEAEGRGRP